MTAEEALQVLLLARDEGLLTPAGSHGDPHWRGPSATAVRGLANDLLRPGGWEVTVVAYSRRCVNTVNVHGHRLSLRRRVGRLRRLKPAK